MQSTSARTLIRGRRGRIGAAVLLTALAATLLTTSPASARHEGHDDEAHDAESEAECNARPGGIWDGSDCLVHYVPLDEGPNVNLSGCLDTTVTTTSCYNRWLQYVQQIDAACRRLTYCIYPLTDTSGRRPGYVSGGRSAVGDSSEYGNGGEFSTDPVDPNYQKAISTAVKNANTCSAAGGSVAEVNRCIARGGRPAVQPEEVHDPTPPLKSEGLDPRHRTDTLGRRGTLGLGDCRGEGNVVEYPGHNCATD